MFFVSFPVSAPLPIPSILSLSHTRTRFLSFYSNSNSQVWVYGNSYESALVAVVVPAESVLRSSLASAGITSDASDASTPLAELCARPDVNKHVLAALTVTGKEAKLKGFEAVKAIHLDARHFSVEDDTLTPTFKLKRPQLLKSYQKVVDELYVKLKK